MKLIDLHVNFLEVDEKTLQLVKELMASQEKVHRSAIELIFTEVKNKIRNLRKDIQDLKSSQQFSQKDIKDLDAKMPINLSQRSGDDILGNCE